VVLVVLGVIVIPFFLKGPTPDSTVTQPISLPPGGGTAVAPQEYTLPLNGAPAAGSHAAPAAATATVAAAPFPSQPAAATPQTKPAVVPGATPAPAAKAPVEPAATGGKWVVQAGSYGSEANASQVMRKLQSHGLHAFISRFQKSGHSYYRVRVGPYAERSQAEHAMSSVARAYGGKAEVVPNS
jgi:cell division septation protein DedD